MENSHTNHITTGAHGVNRNNFDIQPTLKHGWDKFKENWKSLLMAVFAYTIATLPFSVVDGIWSTTRLYQSTYEWNEFLQQDMPVSEWVAGPSETALYVLFFIMMFAWSIIIGYNWYKSYFSIYDSHAYKFSQMFILPNKETFSNFIQYTLGVIAYFLGTLIGLILLIVPGIYFAIRFQFAINLIIDKKMRVGEAFAMSTKMTENIKWKLVGIGLVQILACLGIIIVGLIALVVGVIPALFIAFGWAMMASVGLYRKLYAANN